jgi:para-aminobenzoate synthetase component 1
MFMINEIPFHSKGIAVMNELGKKRTPFLFLIDYRMEKAIILPLDEIDPELLCYEINGFSNIKQPNHTSKELLQFTRHPVSKEIYERGFKHVMKHIRLGNSFLTNLTFATPIISTLGLHDFFFMSKAPFKLWIRDKFTFYSPEKFVTIKEDIIRSYPMKGTIDAEIENAEQILLEDEKEMAEHYTIVDLIRNDLSLVAKNVRVERFRYFDRINTNRKNLLQVSSEIAGDLDKGWYKQIGTIFSLLLPAGSITGAPKKKTMEIIDEAENEPRGYYTGVCGIFDGKALESAVMIRFIEERKGQLFYHSGGGITVNSDCEKEYQEMIEKVYVPVN